MAFNFISPPSTLGLPSPLPTQHTQLMNDLAHQFGFAFLNESWLPQVLMLIAGIVAINIGAYYLLRKIEKITARTPAIWYDARIKAIRKPLTLVLWVAGAGFAIRIVHQHLGTPVSDLVLPARNTIVMPLP
jgi:MscS family membrane protein